MAGIGFELRKIYGRKTLVSNIWGTIYATMTSIGPSIMAAALILALKSVMDHSNVTASSPGEKLRSAPLCSAYSPWEPQFLG